MAAGNVFRLRRPTAFGDRLVVKSVKSNIGYLEGVCALPGILKVVAALEAGEIPPTLGFKTPNLRIDFDKAKARANTDVGPGLKIDSSEPASHQLASVAPMDTALLTMSTMSCRFISSLASSASA